MIRKNNAKSANSLENTNSMEKYRHVVTPKELFPESSTFQMLQGRYMICTQQGSTVVHKWWLTATCKESRV